MDVVPDDHKLAVKQFEFTELADDLLGTKPYAAHYSCLSQLFLIKLGPILGGQVKPAGGI